MEGTISGHPLTAEKVVGAGLRGAAHRTGEDDWAGPKAAGDGDRCPGASAGDIP